MLLVIIFKGINKSVSSTLIVIATSFISTLCMCVMPCRVYASQKRLRMKSRHTVSQNKKRYKNGKYDLDLSYITSIKINIKK